MFVSSPFFGSRVGVGYIQSLLVCIIPRKIDTELFTRLEGHVTCDINAFDFYTAEISHTPDSKVLGRIGNDFIRYLVVIRINSCREIRQERAYILTVCQTYIILPCILRFQLVVSSFTVV